MAADWAPTLSPAVLAERAALLARIRAFFAERGVLEVDTPVLAAHAVTDPALASVAADGGWLQTSPEYHMKRLLAAGSGPIYQLSRAFRAAERGRLHNPEFLLLEFYRPDFDDAALMDELEALLAPVLPGFPARRVPFATLIAEHFGVDVFTADDAALAAALAARWSAAGRDDDPARLADGRTGLLELLYGDAADALAGACFVTDFPPALSALARLRTDDAGRTVAARFELVVDGVELANGFHELCDATEQRARFEADLARRASRGLSTPAIDERFLAALAAGLPDCAGVAVGVDRVLMLAVGATRIEDVMPFPAERA